MNKAFLAIVLRMLLALVPSFAQAIVLDDTLTQRVHSLAAEASRQSAPGLRARQWFAAGDNVRIVAGGSGWRIHGEGQALSPGLEGQTVRVRTESGRIVSGLAIGDRMVEVPL